MAFDLQRFDDPARFREAVLPFLMEREAEHNLLIGLSGLLDGGPYSAPAHPYLVAVRAGERIAVVGLLTPPHRLILSEAAMDVPLQLIVDDLVAGGWAPAGVLAPTRMAHAFADRWRDAVGGSCKPAIREWIYRLETVRFPAPIPGALRPAAAADRALLIDWVRGFYRDALHAALDEATAAASVDSRLADDPPTAFVWDAGAPRSMAMLSGPTPNGIRVNGVYTPPVHRGRGYARACVSALSARALSEGRRFCFLFADADFPTSNFVYESIGYERVSEVQEIDFIPEPRVPKNEASPSSRRAADQSRSSPRAGHS